MNRYKLSKAGVNANEGIARFSGSKEEYERCLMAFPDDGHYQAMLDAIAGKDTRAAFGAAHALKGIAGNLSLLDLYESIRPLVEIFREDSMEGIEPLLEAVETNYQRVIEALQSPGNP